MPTVIGVARDGSADFKSLKAALEAVKALNGKEYELLLKSGDDFTDEGYFTLESNGKFGLFGGKIRPKVFKINTVNTIRDIFQDVLIEGIEFEDGIRLVGGNKGITIYDCKLEHSELTCQHYEGASPEHIVIKRNIFTGAYVLTSSYSQKSRPSNMYIAGVKGSLILEENVIDHGGWHPTIKGAAANMYNHNVYLQHGSDSNGVLVRNNIVTRASSHGIQMRSCGVVEDNFFARNAVGVLMGYSKEPAAAGVKAHVLRNVVQEGHSMMKGVDCGQGPNLITGARWGIDFDCNGDADWQAHDNLVSHISPEDKPFKSTVTNAYYRLDNPKVKKSGNEQYGFGEPSKGGVEQLTKAPPMLADYAAHLGLAKSFDAFMDKVLNRAYGEWDEKYTAKAINAFVRGDQVVADPKPPVVEPEPKPPVLEPKPADPAVEVRGEPLEIEAEKFTRFSDTTPEDGVETTTLPNGATVVGWTYPGEHLEYDLDVAAPQLFDLALIAGTGRKESQPIAVAVDGVEAGRIDVMPGSWDTYAKTEPCRIGLSKGTHSIRLTFVEGGVNLDKLVLTPVETVRIVTREVIPAGAVRVDVDGKKLAIWSE